MMNEVVPFVFQHDGDQTPIRVVRIGENPWFVSPDLGSVLGLENIRQNIANLDPDEKGVCTIYTPGGPQSVGIVSESGMYDLIYLSRKPAAKAFRRWVRKEVLPSIRRTGRYELPSAMPEPVLAAINRVEDILEQIQGTLGDQCPRRGFAEHKVRTVGEGIANHNNCECIYCNNVKVVTKYGVKLPNACNEHHVDGNKSNHSLENLTLPCLDCHQRLTHPERPDHIPAYLALGIAATFHLKLKQKAGQIRPPSAAVGLWDFRAAIQVDMGFPQEAKRER